MRVRVPLSAPISKVVADASGDSAAKLFSKLPKHYVAIQWSPLYNARQLRTRDGAAW